MKEYTVTNNKQTTQNEIVTTKVEANSPEEAIEAAKNFFGKITKKLMATAFNSTNYQIQATNDVQPRLIDS